MILDLQLLTSDRTRRTRDAKEGKRGYQHLHLSTSIRYRSHLRSLPTVFTPFANYSSSPPPSLFWLLPTLPSAPLSPLTQPSHQLTPLTLVQLFRPFLTHSHKHSHEHLFRIQVSLHTFTQTTLTRLVSKRPGASRARFCYPPANALVR